MRHQSDCRAKKWVGAYAATLGGIDTLVFAGGIGENAGPVRARIFDGLSFLGIERNGQDMPEIREWRWKAAVAQA